MSFQEKNVVASMLTMLLVLAVFHPRIQANYHLGQFDGPAGLITLGKTGLYFVAASVIGNISALILLNILHAAITGDNAPSSLVDEHDKMVGRRGTQIFGAVAGIGLISAMSAPLALGGAAVPVFSIILLSFALAELASGFAKTTMFRLGW